MRVPSLDAARGLGAADRCAAALGSGIGPIPRFGLAGVASRPGDRLAAGALCAARGSCAPAGRAITPALARRALSARDVLRHPARSARWRPSRRCRSVLTVLILTGAGRALRHRGAGRLRHRRARLEFLLVPIAFAVGVASVPMVGMAIGARDVARARRAAWTGAACAACALGLIGLACRRSVPRVVRALHHAIPPCLPPPILSAPGRTGVCFVGLGLVLYFSSAVSRRAASVGRLAATASVWRWLSRRRLAGWEMTTATRLTRCCAPAASGSRQAVCVAGNRRRSPLHVLGATHLGRHPRQSRRRTNCLT